MERVKLKHFARPDMVSDPDWEQGMEVAVKYIAKKISRLNHCGALNDSVFGIPAAEHFVFAAFDKLFTGQWEWSAHRTIHTQLVKIALSDISHHLRDWKKQHHVQMEELDERVADRLSEDEDFLDIVYEMAEKIANGDPDLLAYLKSMRCCNNCLVLRVESLETVEKLIVVSIKVCNTLCTHRVPVSMAATRRCRLRWKTGWTTPFRSMPPPRRATSCLPTATRSSTTSPAPA